MPAPIAEVDVSQLPVVPSDEIVVVDVREDDEWRAGHIDGAVHIPMSEVPSRLDEIPAGRRLLVVCRSGGRSGQVAGFLGSQGRDAVNLAGGMKAWETAGRPMSSADALPPRVV